MNTLLLLFLLVFGPLLQPTPPPEPPLIYGFLQTQVPTPILLVAAQDNINSPLDIIINLPTGIQGTVISTPEGFTCEGTTVIHCLGHGGDRYIVYVQIALTINPIRAGSWLDVPLEVVSAAGTRNGTARFQASGDPPAEATLLLEWEDTTALHIAWNGATEHTCLYIDTTLAEDVLIPLRLNCGVSGDVTLVAGNDDAANTAKPNKRLTLVDNTVELAEAIIPWPVHITLPIIAIP